MSAHHATIEDLLWALNRLSENEKQAPLTIRNNDGDSVHVILTYPDHGVAGVLKAELCAAPTKFGVAVSVSRK